MKDLLRAVDDIPVTLLVAIAWGTLAVLTNPFGPADEFPHHLHDFGWLTPGLAADGAPWRLLAYSFLHGGLVHLLMNMTGLFAFGPALERSLGSVRFALLYLLTALTGGLAVCLFCDPRQPVVGGSGALFGLMGAVLAMNMRSGRHVFAFLDFEGPRRFLGWIVVQIVIGFLLPMISNECHIGGLIGGCVVTFLWLRPGDVTRTLWHWRLATAALGASLLFCSLLPVTRYDWLAGAAARATNAAQQEALLRAAWRAAPRDLILQAGPDAPGRPRGR